MKYCKLYALPINVMGTVNNVIFQKNVSRRLMELGFIKGEKVRVISKSPKEKSYIISLMDSNLLMHKDTLSLIEVEYE